MTGPCAKLTVTCTLVTPEGIAVIGANYCENPQPKCPRLPGEGYEKCKTICKQAGHAEQVAVDVARKCGIDIKGAHAYIEGHTYACMDCQHALTAAGVRTFTIGKPTGA